MLGLRDKDSSGRPPQSTESKQSDPEFLFIIGFVLCVVGYFFFFSFKLKSCKVPPSASPLRWLAGGLKHPGWRHKPHWGACPGSEGSGCGPVTARRHLGGSGICASIPPGSFCTICEHSRSGPSGNTSCSAAETEMFVLFLGGGGGGQRRVPGWE